MNKHTDNKLRVLSILSENLKNQQPQLVDIEQISEELQLEKFKIRPLLLTMSASGEIECDMDGQHCLITTTGVKSFQKMKNGTSAADF